MSIFRQQLTETLRLSLPVSIGMLGHIMLGLADSLMVGRVGPEALAASSLVNGLVWLVVVFGMGLSMAISPLVAIERGKDRTASCGVILRHAVWLNGAAGVLLGVIVFRLARLIPLLNQSPEVARLAVSYARIIAWSILPFILFQTFRQYIEGLSLMKPAMYVVLLANAVNVIGNYAFIYGHWGVPAYGLDGAGYSTFISRLFMALVLMIYVLKAGSLKAFDPGLRIRRFKPEVIKELVRIGVPSGFQHFFEIGAFSISAVMIGWLGSLQLAAHQIALSMASVSFMIILGVSVASTVRVGTALGRGDMVQVRRAGFTGLGVALSFMALSGLVFVLFRRQLPYLFVDDAQVAQIAATLLIVAAMFQLSDGAQAVGLGILRGIKDVKIPTVITFVAYWVIGLPVGYWLAFPLGYGVTGVWLGFLAGLSTAGIVFIIRFYRLTKNHK